MNKKTVNFKVSHYTKKISIELKKNSYSNLQTISFKKNSPQISSTTSVISSSKSEPFKQSFVKYWWRFSVTETFETLSEKLKSSSFASTLNRCCVRDNEFISTIFVSDKISESFEIDSLLFVFLKKIFKKN